MTPEAINMAMAELDGWEHLRYSGCGRMSLWGFKRQPDSPSVWSAGCVGDRGIPHVYIDDLNAVASVVRALSAINRIVYQSILGEMCNEPPYAIDAKPAARCEAILRATGKWED